MTGDVLVESQKGPLLEQMHAAVVTSFSEPPHYLPVDVPACTDENQQLVEVLTVGLHPRVRTDASGQHYTSTGKLPMIPGVDGVGRLSDGRRVYFVADDEMPGPMAEKTVIDMRRAVVLPETANAELIAAAMNPAMSAWVALRRRVPLQPGQSVLVLGATGNAGTMAVQIAKHLHAGRVIGAGRDPDRLAALIGLGADDVVQLTEDDAVTAAALASVAADVDIVIDYLWGAPTQHAMMALLTARADRSRAIDWIEIGAVAGSTLQLPSVVLRSANLRIQGNGQGAVSTAGYLAELPALIDEISAGRFRLVPRPVPLRDVEAAWTSECPPGQRTVIVP